MHQLDAFAAVDPQTHTHKAARIRRDLGITRSQLGAEIRSPKWTEVAAEYLRDYARTVAAGQPFLIEHAIEASYARVPPAKDGRAWGAATTAAARREWIEKTGNVASARSSNLSPKPLWRKVP